MINCGQKTSDFKKKKKDDCFFFKKFYEGMAQQYVFVKSQCVLTPSILSVNFTGNLYFWVSIILFFESRYLVSNAAELQTLTRKL